MPLVTAIALSGAILCAMMLVLTWAARPERLASDRTPKRNGVCWFGHEWGEWRHDGHYIDTYDAQVRICQRKRCRKQWRSTPIFPGGHPRHGQERRRA